MIPFHYQTVRCESVNSLWNFNKISHLLYDLYKFSELMLAVSFVVDDSILDDAGGE